MTDEPRSNLASSGITPAGTTRAEAKAARREQLLSVAKNLFARNGFHGVRLDDLGKGAGISAPAVYRHFDSKEAVLEELLVGISEYLHDGGLRVIGATPGDAASPSTSAQHLNALGPPTDRSVLETDSHSPAEVLARLIDIHVDFAMSEPELIRIQDRDFPALPEESRRAVRRLQRSYVSDWSAVVAKVHPDWTAEEATVRVHAVFGMINSTPYLARNLSAEVVASQLRTAARASLGI